MKISEIGLSFVYYFDKKTLQKTVGLVVVIVVFIVICLVPSIKSSNVLREKYKEVENNVIRSVSKINDFPKLQRQKEEVESFVNARLDCLINEGEKTRLIGDVSDLAKASGVAIVSMRPQHYDRELSEEFLQQFKPLSYELILESDYHAFGILLNKIENFEIILSVNEFTLERSENDENLLMIKLVITTYAKV